jgi:DNA-binding GntR family transcriptional regulator
MTGSLAARAANGFGNLDPKIQYAPTPMPPTTPANATALVLDTVRAEILSGRLEAGATLRQEELAERFDVSRMPVREALKRLEGEGLVEVLPSRRVRVAALSRAEIEDVYDMRAALEPLAVRIAVPRLTRAGLRDAAHALEAADDELDAATFGARNAAFHLALMVPCERPRLLAAVGSLLDVSDRYQRVALHDPDHNARVRDEHHRLLDAAAAGDGDRAARLIEDHVRSAGARLLGLFA